MYGSDNEELDDLNRWVIMDVVGEGIFDVLKKAIENPDIEITCISSSMGDKQEMANMLDSVQPTNFRMKDEHTIAFDFPEHVGHLDFRYIGVGRVFKDKPEHMAKRCTFRLDDISQIAYYKDGCIRIDLWVNPDINVFFPDEEFFELELKHKKVYGNTTEES